MTTVRFTKDIDNKLAVLTELENASKSEIIKKAIIEYYDQHIQNASPYELGKDLFGKYEGAEDLASTYKSKLKAKLGEKHSH